MNDQQIEQEIQARGLTTGRRITPADVQANIAEEHFFTAAQGVIGAHMSTIPTGAIPGAPVALTLVTICVLTLRNGFTVVGVNQGPASPENFDPEMGREMARRKAVDQVWPLMGYELRTELSRPVLTEADAQADLEGRARPDNPGSREG